MEANISVEGQYALDLVVGARPNLVKVAPLSRELQHEDRLNFASSL